MSGPSYFGTLGLSELVDANAMVMTAMECTWLLSWVAILQNCIEGLVSVSVRDSKISRFVDDS